MKKIQTGFIGIALLIISAFLVGIGGTYYVLKNDTKEIEIETVRDVTSAPISIPTETVENNQKLTDSMIVSSIDSRYKKTNTGYTFESEGWHHSINGIYKGDFTNDGYEDAIVLSTACSASCGSGISFFVNTRDGKVKAIDNINFPKEFQFVGAGKTYVTKITIQNGIISMTAKNFCSALDEYKSCTSFVTDKTMDFRLEGNTLVKIK